MFCGNNCPSAKIMPLLWQFLRPRSFKFFDHDNRGACAFGRLIEPVIRVAVQEEVDAAFSRFGSHRRSTEQSCGPYQQKLQLWCESELSESVYTEGNIAAIKVVLHDASSGTTKISGPESSVKVLAVVLQGEFNRKDEEDWTREEFESHEVKEREGKRPLLLGNQQVTLEEGVGYLTNLSFSDNSSWVRSKKFRIGLKVAPGYCESIRIREAKTNAFTVKDHRGEASKKHYPPALFDDVWRLEKIGKDGKYHDRLNKAGIYTVKDFLRHLVLDPKNLRHILGGRGLSNKTWAIIEGHANTCRSNGKHYVYYIDDSKGEGVIFNDAYKLKFLIADDRNCPADSLSDNQKLFADKLIKKACNDLDRIMEYDEIVDHKQNIAGMQRTPYDTFNLQIPSTCFTPVIQEQPTIEEELLPGGISSNRKTTTEDLIPSQNSNSCLNLQFDGPSSSSQQMNIILGPAPGSAHSSISGLISRSPLNLHADSYTYDYFPSFGEADPSMMWQVDHSGYDMLQGHHAASVSGSENFHVTHKGYSLSSGLSSLQKCSQDNIQMWLSGVSSQQNDIQVEGQVLSSKKAFPKWHKLNVVIMCVIRIRNKLAKKAEGRLAHVLPML